ncbi:hypothetical protein CCAX7_004470 [Capsulimonas corticalis]|uniref:Uncharacterized protein n=1 Tax=Capsulimonas corticalis TaxID=2219043 RepID=A0A402D2Z7_9BACT|nr:protease pro-enzyme activation domain-containing protein [Capsulimonas corticalis]BDI28396.1 hypothetical protein CCAX7_004470 [Capsulimonas corticalis]
MKIRAFARQIAGAIAALCVISHPADAAQARITLAGHLPVAALANAQAVDQVPDSDPIPLALTLPLRNTAELTDLINRLQDPSDPLYGKYLKPSEFTQRFSPTPEQYQNAISFARANGFTITKQHANRLLLDVSAPAKATENAFAVRLNRYLGSNGHAFYAPDREPSLPASMQGVIANIVGLDNSTVWRPHNSLVTPANIAQNPNQIGTGPGAGMTPNDIRAAYGLTGVTPTGAGQTLGLFQLDGYSPTDITSYQTKYGLPNIPIQNVYVGGLTGPTGDVGGTGEATLDIELQMALAPGASKIVVYQAPNTGAGILACYNQIANDDLATSVSTSWGTPEGNIPYNVLDSENAIFQQMAAQGQTMFAASGDNGAYDDGATLSVDDPAAQPYVTGVGGTTLATTKAGGTWVSEKPWANAADKSRSRLGSGSGGGFSSYWPLPSYQSGFISVASQGSLISRNVPDVALAGDTSTGYSIFFKGGWYIFGGTSCAAPVWSAFAALVNEQRATAGLSPLGFANPALYNLAKTASYATDFHDSTTGTNLFYPAVTKYDLATGLGSFNGINLLSDLAPLPVVTNPTPPKSPTGVTAAAGSTQIFLSWSAVSGATSYNIYRGTKAGAEATTAVKTGVTSPSIADTGLTNGTTYYYKVTAVSGGGESAQSAEVSAKPSSTAFVQILGDPGFESGSSSTPWVASSGVISPNAAYSGAWKAAICGTVNVSDYLYQQATIPATAISAKLSFALKITTTDSLTVRHDYVYIQVRDAATGAVLGNLGYFSNMSASSSYSTKSYSLTAYKGKSIQIWLYDSQDATLPTTFYVDNFALNVQ